MPKFSEGLVVDADLSALHGSPDNPREISDERRESLKYSLEHDPDMMKARPIIATLDGEVVCGNMRLLVCTEDMGWTTGPVYFKDLTPARKIEWMLRDNQEYGDWVPDELSALVHRAATELGADMRLTGFHELEIEELLARACAEPDVPREERQETAGELEPVPDPTTRRGDLYELGDHMLLCGDSTDLSDVDHLLGTNDVNLVVTSPPYFNQRQYSHWDTYEEFAAFLRDVFSNALTHSGNPFVFFLNMGDSQTDNLRLSGHAADILEDIGLTYLDSIVWKKAGAVYDIPRSAHIKSNGFYYPALGWEPVLVFRKGDTMPRMTEEAIDHMGLHHTNVWEIPQVVGTVQKKLGHNAPFPIELATRAIMAYGEQDGIVYDPFGGAGTTLIAAERLGRRSFLMEVDPGYCDRICERYLDQTGKEPRLVDRLEVDDTPAVA